MKEIILVGLGGFIGSILRYAVAILAKNVIPEIDFPVATLLVNAVGSFIIGAFGWLLAQQGSSMQLWLFVGVGICGGFTTFSTFSLENYSMILQGRIMEVLLYALGSVLIGLICVWGGVWVAQKLG